jgi:hypothetical protein
LDDGSEELHKRTASLAFWVCAATALGPRVTAARGTLGPACWAGLSCCAVWCGGGGVVMKRWANCAYKRLRRGVVCLLTSGCPCQSELNGPRIEAVLAPLESAAVAVAGLSWAEACARMGQLGYSKNNSGPFTGTRHGLVFKSQSHHREAAEQIPTGLRQLELTWSGSPTRARSIELWL